MQAWLWSQLGETEYVVLILQQKYDLKWRVVKHHVSDTSAKNVQPPLWTVLYNHAWSSFVSSDEFKKKISCSTWNWYEGRLDHLNSLGIRYIDIKFNAVMPSAMTQMVIKMAMIYQIYLWCRPSEGALFLWTYSFFPMSSLLSCIPGSLQKFGLTHCVLATHYVALDLKDKSQISNQ